ncbi:MAG: BatA domain-containing protein [Acidobacteria bacterium]|nr:BatA domain-containing protein [Acidobacteriota bacterium]
MTFLAPLFLAGLAALAVPVLIHLIQRERKTVTAFPSLMFLRRIPYQSVRRRRIRHWALLALRLVALALIIAAFARPFLRATSAAAMAGGARDVIVVVDRSYSMGYADTWSRARAAARQAVEELEPSDRASLVLFAGDAEVVARSSADRAQLLAALEAFAPSRSARVRSPTSPSRPWPCNARRFQGASGRWYRRA